MKGAKIIAKREDETFSTISPNDVAVEDAKKILEFLNTVRSPKDLAEAVEFRGERDVGIKVAERIMAKRAELGGQFKSLQDVANVTMVGPKRFTDIVMSAAGKNIQVEPERLQFRALLLKNPNYFGNVTTAPFEPVKVIASNTSYEELMCIGYNPQFKRLEAVVHVKQQSGYGTGICSVGTPEYVRFYIDWDNTGTWTDLGIVSFDAYNIPSTKPLEYDVTLNIDPKEKFCSIENLPKVRAILSWNNPPPANTPNFPPVWGNVKESRIQIDALKFFLPKDILDIIKVGDNIKKIPDIGPILEVEEPIPIPKPKPLAVAELAELYKEKGVPPHRFAFAEVTKLISNPSFAKPFAISGLKGIMPAAGIDIKIDDLIDIILKTDGDTRYEELTCVGLNRDQDTLVGIIKVKLPNGYSGSLCSAGSTEYVAFWLDWGDGAGWTYAGTTSVQVHDLSKIPSEGLYYSAFLPLNSFARRRPCENGALTPKVRAILSWQTPPPAANPNYVPTWGNREETTVQIMPGPKITGHLPFIETVGNMSVASIDSLTGLADGPAVGAGFEATESPFGGLVVISGHIAYPPDVLGGGAMPFKYRVSVSDDGGATWQSLNNKFKIWLTELNSGVWSGPTPFDQTADAEGWYEYKEDIQGSSMRFVSQNVLAHWQTAGATMNGLRKIKIEAKDPVTNTIYPGTQVITVKLDNIAPSASISITSGGGGCADFLIGDTISGNYSVSDMHFGSLNISVEPNLGGVNFTSPPILPREYPMVPTTGEAGTWSLDTLLMPRCGYIVRLTARDRTIVNSGSVGFQTPAVVGLCLREKKS